MSALSGLWSIAAVMLLGALVSTAQAGARSPCSDPIVFDSGVQVHIFPFTTDTRLTKEGQALATLLQRHVLFAALKYPSIGVQELISDDSPCNFGQVAGRISARLKAGQTGIFMWGRIFEQDGRIYLKSYVRVKAPADKSEIRWPLAADPQATIITHVPLAIEGFAPRTIPVSFLERLEPSQQMALRIHSEPNAQSSSSPLPKGVRYSFLVFEARDDWMRVRVKPFDAEGWMPAHALVSGQALKGEFPELYFVDALIGYFSIAGNPEKDRRLFELTRGSFDQYLNVTEGRAEPDARALAMVLTGNARLRAAGSEWSTATLSAVMNDYQRAAKESPTWTPAQAHLLANASMLCVRAACEGGAANLEGRFLGAIARDPLSVDLVNGLSAYYQAAKLHRLTTDLSPDALQLRAQKVQSVKSRMSQD